MKKFQSLLTLTTLALAVALSGHKTVAQGGYGGGGYGGGGYGGGGGPGGGGFRALMTDPTQRAQMMVDGMRDSLAVTNDAEWSVISPRLLKVIQLKSEDSLAEIARMAAPMIAMMGGGAGGMAGGANPLGVQPNPSADALQQALDNNGTVAQVKAALAKFRAARKLKQDALAKAQDALKEVLSVRQEAVLALAGYLE